MINIIYRTFIFLSVFCASLCSVCNFSCTTQFAGGTETGTGMVAGVLYEPCGTKVARNADVRIRLASVLPDTAGSAQVNVASGKTDTGGRYSFVAVDTGVYVVEGSDSANNRVLIQDVHVASTDSTRTLGPDTLEPAGAIKGKIVLSQGGDPRKVLILAFGVDRLAHVDSNGSFLFTDLARGTYTLRVLPLLADYGVLDTGGIMVKPKDTTDLGSFGPRFIGIPTPTNVTISYDSLLQIATLRWSKADPRLVKSYNVYRRNVDSNTVFARINISPVPDTVYRDTTGVQDMTYEYAVYALDSMSKEGSESAVVRATIRSSFVLLKTIDVTNISNCVAKAIQTPDNKLFVLSRSPTKALFVLDSNQSVIDTIGLGLFSDPVDVAIDTAEELFVVDNAAHRIFKFDTGGTLLLQWDMSAPGKVVTIIDSTLVAGTTKDVELFSLDGTYYTSFPVIDPSITGIAQSSDGSLIIYNNSTILKFSRSGTLLDSIYNFVENPQETRNTQGYLVLLKPGVLLFAFDRVLYSIDEQGTLMAKARFNGAPSGMFVNKSKNTVLICDSNGHILEYQR
jgi:hypothetical protein